MAMALNPEHVLSANPPSLEQEQSLHLQHELNKEKQVNKLVNNANRTSLEIEINCNNENVNILCSPGFYSLIARLSLLSLSQGFQETCRNVTFELRSVVSHKEMSGTLQSSVLKLLFLVDLMEHGLTISLHHTTQKVQIQGGSKMADGSTAAVFALNNFFTDIFKSRAKEHKDTIDQFNSALIDLAQRKAEKANGNGNI